MQNPSTASTSSMMSTESMTRRLALAALALLLALPSASRAASLYTDAQAWNKATGGAGTSARAKAQAKNPAMAFVANDPALPNVLLIGDSISVGYTANVRDELKGKANVYRITENGGDTGRGVEKLDAWLAGEKWAAIHFNFGLHDLKHWKDNKMDMSGPVVNTPEQYGKNLEQLVRRMKATGARLIFATTTPVPEGSAGREAGAEVIYNDVALKIMKAQGVAVDDLCGFVKPDLAKYQLPKNVHFNPEGYAALGKQVAGEIAKSLGGAKDQKSAKKGKKGGKKK